MKITGSSPLARGLLASSSIPEAASGIIPARAGFTSGRCRSRTPATDHPRSRGVYHHGRDTLVAQGGSSPLARGLRPEPRVGQLLQRIIPARAGFTATSAAIRSSRRDHPRSRGVYRGDVRPLSRLRGSSPLARGLLLHGVALGRGYGIIPARAGFTLQELPIKQLDQDHPRSRGVYSAAPGHWVQRCGIIPARAGFTSQRQRDERLHRDHPRSRGVYSQIRTSVMCPAGSSPLARGLRLGELIVTFDARIIPARAGFTSCPS